MVNPKDKSIHNSIDWSRLYLQVHIPPCLEKMIRFSVCRLLENTISNWYNSSLWAHYQESTSPPSSFWPSSWNNNKITQWLTFKIEPVPSAIDKNCSRDRKATRWKNKTKRENSEIPEFECKVIVLFHIKLKLFLWPCVKLVNTCKIHC